MHATGASTHATRHGWGCLQVRSRLPPSLTLHLCPCTSAPLSVCRLQEPGKIFLVLEHCSGGDLAAYLRRYGRLRELPARFVLSQLAEGLKALRANNVIHVRGTGGEGGH